MWFQLARSVMFRFSAETSHHLGLTSLGVAHRLGLLRSLPSVPAAPVTVMGRTFPNPVGLAAGLDKNGDYIDALGALGFGFIEIGTVTPRPQPGNPRPRLFRLAPQRAIINRMGFNNKGVDYLIERVKASAYDGVLGINIGKNFDTPVEQALDDYLIGLRKVYEYAGYVVINISSPNTQGLRNLQQADSLDQLLEGLRTCQLELAQRHHRYVPLVVKIAPDLEADEISAIARACERHRLDGIIATNTTLSRDGVEDSPFKDEAGGLSGRPLQQRATAVLKQLTRELKAEIPVIGVGGIDGGAAAVEKIASGAALVQIYSGFIYAGPALIRDCVTAIKNAPSREDGA